MTLMKKLRFGLLFINLLNILECIWWSLHSSFLFVVMGKRWRKVIYLCREIKKSYKRNPNIKPYIFQILGASTFVTLSRFWLFKSLGAWVNLLKNGNLWRKSFLRKCWIRFWKVVKNDICLCKSSCDVKQQEIKELGD